MIIGAVLYENYVGNANNFSFIIANTRQNDFVLYHLLAAGINHIFH